MRRRPLLAGLAAGLATPLLSRGAAAQDGWPSRPITLVVPWAPGGSNDIVARLVAPALSERLGQSVVVENRAGGGGSIGMGLVTRARPDGHTLLVSSASNPRLQTLADLVQAGRESQKKLNVGTYTAGFHLSAEWFGAVTKTRHVNVPYRGAPEVFLGLLGNQLDWSVSDLIAAMPQVKAGKLRALAVTGDIRHPDYPEIPTAKELGYPEYVNYTWTTLTVRSETPEAVTNRLVEAVQKVLALPATKEFTRKIGSDPLNLATGDMRRFQISEIERFRAVANSAGIKPE